MLVRTSAALVSSAFPTGSLQSKEVENEYALSPGSTFGREGYRQPWGYKPCRKAIHQGLLIECCIAGTERIVLFSP